MPPGIFPVMHWDRSSPPHLAEFKEIIKTWPYCSSHTNHGQAVSPLWFHPSTLGWPLGWESLE